MSNNKNKHTLEIRRNEQGQRVLSAKEWFFVVVVGLAGQLIWCVENTWYPNFIYAKIEAKSRKTDPFMALVASMVVEPALGSGAPVTLPPIGAIRL